MKIKTTLSPLICAVWISCPAQAVALKNARELLAFYENATGISSQTNNVRYVYGKVRSLLPETGTVTLLSSPGTMAAVELAAVFCQGLVNKEAASNAGSRRAFPLVDFTLNPNALPNSAISDSVQRLTMLFWERHPDAAELAVFQALENSLRVSSPISTVGTKQLLTALCTSVASSIEALVYRD